MEIVLDKSSLPESERDLLENKTIVVLGDEQVNDKWIRSTLTNYGIKLILVETESDIAPHGEVYKYIQYDFTDHRQDETHADRIAQILTALELSINGCCTFTDKCGPLAAYLCERLELTGGAGVLGATNVRSKSSTHMYLQKETNGVRQFPRTYQFSGRSAKITCAESLRSAEKTVGFPAVRKPDKESFAYGVHLIRNKEEYERLGEKLADGNSMMIMEYFDGTEHDIDVIIYEGEVIAAIVSDNGPTRKGSFVETSMSMPTCLPPSKAAQLRRAASHCCIDIGLRNGVFNVEMKFTSTGPKLLEINGRMNGIYIRDWTYTCFGFDPLWYVMVIASGIRPPVPIEKSDVHMMGITCAWPVHQHLLCQKQFGTQIDDLIKSGEIHFFGKKFYDREDSNTGNAVLVCNVAVVKHDLPHAKSELLKICELLGIHTSLFDVPKYLSDFVHSNSLM
ncbi:carnosine synthase 1-like [Pecten maximus]|uniref:carnosine synthase 1-like n=1 Tax=Pecten maximus TaxID=6579 RepID=UPI00145810F9|nr:carnosine synthase 1-like [Pecten maximus]